MFWQMANLNLYHVTKLSLQKLVISSTQTALVLSIRITLDSFCWLEKLSTLIWRFKSFFNVILNFFNDSLRARLHGGGGSQSGEVIQLGVVTCLSI